MEQVDIVDLTGEVEEMQVIVELQLLALKRFRRDPGKLALAMEFTAEALSAHLSGAMISLHDAQNDS